MHEAQLATERSKAASLQKSLEATEKERAEVQTAFAALKESTEKQIADLDAQLEKLQSQLAASMKSGKNLKERMEESAKISQEEIASHQVHAFPALAIHGSREQAADGSPSDGRRQLSFPRARTPGRDCKAAEAA